MKREVQVDENSAGNSQPSKCFKALKGKDESLGIEVVSANATQSFLKENELEMLSGFYGEESSFRKSVDELDIPWYLEEALPFYPRHGRTGRSLRSRASER